MRRARQHLVDRRRRDVHAVSLDPVIGDHARSGRGTQLLLLHPFGTSRHVWDETLPVLAHHADVFAPTLPGHAGGPALQSPATAATMARQVAAMLDRLGWERPHVVGNSIGGWIAFELARMGRASSVTAIAPAGGWVPWSRPVLTLGAGFLAVLPFVGIAGPLVPLATAHPRLRRLAMRPLVANGHLVERRRATRLLRTPGRASGLWSIVSGAASSPAITDLGAIPVPVQLVTCDRDIITPAHWFAGRFLDELPDVRHVRLRDVGHVPMIEAPHRVAVVIMEHVNRVMSSAGGPGDD
ncbi:MAG: alpha/beta fold hydrolase [Nitriliruptorales bacterium]|nr:alpha/beta fold hydrolase [Nitriliruptorales bacterium]